MALDPVVALKEIWSNASSREKTAWNANPIDATVTGTSITYTTVGNKQPSYALDRYSTEKLKLKFGCVYSVSWDGTRVNYRPCPHSDTFLYLLDGSDQLLDNSIQMGEV